MKLHAFGDSHVSFLLDRVAQVDVNYLGPITMHRVGRDGLKKFLRPAGAYEPTDVFIFVFGEIDVRCHIGRIAAETRRPRVDVIKELVRDFLTAIQEEMRAHGSPKTVILLVIPPGEGGWVNEKFPVYGSIEDRIEITLLLNAELTRMGQAFDFDFLDIGRYYRDKRGALRGTISDDGVHIAPDCVKPLIRELSKLVNVRLDYDPYRSIQAKAPQRRVGRAKEIILRLIRRLGLQNFRR